MNSTISNPNRTAVIAATAGPRRQGPYKAVMLKQTRGGLQLLWKTTEQDQTVDLRAFVQKVMPAVSSESNGLAPAAVVGLDGGGVAFYRVDVPPVPDNQLGTIIRMQAESLLPLPADQMRMTWRAGIASDGKRSCSIAAARSDQLRRFAADAGDNVTQILLDAEAVVKAWMELFNGTIEKSVLINLRGDDCQVLLTDSGQLAHAVTLETGQNDLSTDESEGNYELFVHDLRNALELFGEDVSGQTSLYVISENESTHQGLIAYLKAAGLNAYPVVPSSRVLRYGQPDGKDDIPRDAIAAGAGVADVVTAGDICRYIEPIGLAMMAMEGDADRLNLFDGLLGETDTKDRAKVIQRIKLACLVTAVAAVVCLAVYMVLDKASLTKLKGIEVTQLIEQQKMKQLIAENRPDVLGIITSVNECGLSGMMLDSFEYKAGKVTIASFAKSLEQVFEFEKNLNGKANIANVKILSPTYDEKKKRVNFKIQFEYVNPFKKKK